MILLQLSNIHKSFGATPILQQINLTLSEGEKLGLVGVNGAGKSTLLKIITGELLPDSGTVTLAKDKTMGYLAQDSGLNSDQTIWDEMLGVFQPLIEKERELRHLESRMSDPDMIKDLDAHKKLMEQYARLSEEFRNLDGFSYQARIRNMLTGFGFPEAVWQERISTLSGGQKTRLAFVKLLLQAPDLLVLDEPTNHLDIETLNWLENYLQNYKGAILVVSHDRYFLDKIVTGIYEISQTRGRRFHGNYTDYQRQKKELYQLALKAYEEQQEEIERQEEFIRRNIARASTSKRAQSRRKALEKMKRLERPTQERAISSLQFQIERTTGDQVLTVDGLSIGYNGNPVAENLNFTVERGERIAIIGPNGSGKSTLLKTLTQQIQPLAGRFEWGSQVKLGYYDQEQATLNGSKTVIEEIRDEYPLLTETQIRAHLGRFLFSGEDVEKTVSSLSGGEKARLALAKLMLAKANVLLLDEPTNHLDIMSKEVLEQALLDFPGTLIFISHDRYFLNRISTKTIYLTRSGVEIYLGNYDYFLEKKEELAELKGLKTCARPAKGVTENSFEAQKEIKRRMRKIERRLEELEALIEQNEQKILALEEDLCKPEVYQDADKLRLLQEEISSLKEETEALMQEWEELSLELEGLQNDPA